MMSKEYDIDMIISVDTLKQNQKKEIKKGIIRRKEAKRKYINKWILALIEAPIIMFIMYVIYCAMWLVIGG